MKKAWYRFRNWALEKLANGDPVALNVATTGLFMESAQGNAFFCNISIKPIDDDCEWINLVPPSQQQPAE